MTEKAQKQLTKMLGSLTAAIEGRDAKAIAQAVGPDAMVSAFGDVFNAKELQEAIALHAGRAEELVVNVGNPSKFKESKEAVTVSFPVEVSFVDTSEWTLRRYSLSAAFRMKSTADGFAFQNIVFGDLKGLDVIKPSIPGIEGGTSKEVMMGGFGSFPGGFGPMVNPGFMTPAGFGGSWGGFNPGGFGGFGGFGTLGVSDEELMGLGGRRGMPTTMPMPTPMPMYHGGGPVYLTPNPMGPLVYPPFPHSPYIPWTGGPFGFDPWITAGVSR